MRTTAKTANHAIKVKIATSRSMLCQTLSNILYTVIRHAKDDFQHPCIFIVLNVINYRIKHDQDARKDECVINIARILAKSVKIIIPMIIR